MSFAGTRVAAVAGSFYSADPDALRRDVSRFLDEGRQKVGGLPVARAVVAPHAGYIYSGPIAGSAFARLGEQKDGIGRIVILGPAHREWVQGLALCSSECFATPLGNLVLDRDAAGQILDLPQVSVQSSAHRLEHSLEVEFPFLRVLFPKAPIVPLVVGVSTREEVAEVIETLWSETTAIVVSSDLSHFHTYREAHLQDRKTAEKIKGLDATLKPSEACGAASINGLLLAASHLGLKVEELDLRNSGDISGDRSRVVGYGAFAVH